MKNEEEYKPRYAYHFRYRVDRIEPEHGVIIVEDWSLPTEEEVISTITRKRQDLEESRHIIKVLGYHKEELKEDED